MKIPMSPFFQRSAEPTVSTQLGNAEDCILMNLQRTVTTIRASQHLPLAVTTTFVKCLLRIRRRQVELTRLNPDLQQMDGLAAGRIDLAVADAAANSARPA